ncbi:MAG: hypothetical protein J6K43_15325 [Lachnospiraceae bacterium]|nr:hypothetical protein [Lachnospiraceae bacterium]
MTSKEKLLEIQSYEEFDRRREEFRDLKFDREIVEHMSKIFSDITPVNKEVHEDFLFEKK